MRLSGVIFVHFLLPIYKLIHTHTHTPYCPMCFFLVGVRTRCPLLIQDNTYSHISQDCSILFSILLYSIFYFHLPFFWVSPHNRL